jgi:beta-N-acetylhexosaminidase
MTEQQYQPLQYHPLQYHPLGNHLIVGLHGTKLTADEKSMLKRLQPVGILLFSRNFNHDMRYPEWTQCLNDLLSEVRELTKRDRLLISIDHEGGHVVRTPAPLTKFPYACQYSSRAYQVAQSMATELLSIGVNVSFAPVADIHSNVNNPVIGPRAFANDAASTSSAVVEFLKGLNSMGIAGCAKHFPGHGDTSVDSHRALPVQSATLQEIRQRELIPMKALIDLQVPLIMTAHIMFPAIDQEAPATLSSKILRQLLRDELNFNGIIISDDLEMNAISNAFLNKDGLVQAFQAGNDMLIIARSPSYPFDMALKIEQSFEEHHHRLDTASLEESKSRIERFLITLPQPQVTTLPKETFQANHYLAIECAYGR